jgi:acetyl esterase/lipase
MRRVLLAAALLVAIAGAAFLLSPWPSVFVIRKIFDKGAAEASERLAPQVPRDVISRSGIRYDPADDDAVLDIYAPSTAAPGTLPTIVWVHGGGFISGRREDVANYAKILAGKGFAVVNIDYTIAPEATYPRPVVQLNRALQFITANSGRLALDANRLLLAGDSAGAQIAAQTANLVTSPAYARAVGISPSIRPEQLKGVLLFCGPYDLGMFGDGWFTRTTAWSYSGTRNFRANETFRLMSVAKYVTPNFPPAFITAGNSDPLGPQSVALAEALNAKGVEVDGLFFAKDRQPRLAHEYQFDLRDSAAVEALNRAVAFAKQAAGWSASGNSR